jgi:hypothetical protein
LVIKKLQFDQEEMSIRVKELSEKSQTTGARHDDLSNKLEIEMDEKNKLKIALEKMKVEK